MNKNNKVVDFEIKSAKPFFDEYELYGILESEVFGKKKYGRKNVVTKRVLIANRLSQSEATTMLLMYKTFLKFKTQMDRVDKILSKKGLEVNEDLNGVYVDAHNDYVL